MGLIAFSPLMKWKIIHYVSILSQSISQAVNEWRISFLNMSPIIMSFVSLSGQLSLLTSVLGVLVWCQVQSRTLPLSIAQLQGLCPHESFSRSVACCGFLYDKTQICEVTTLTTFCSTPSLKSLTLFYKQNFSCYIFYLWDFVCYLQHKHFKGVAGVVFKIIRNQIEIRYWCFFKVNVYM